MAFLGSRNLLCIDTSKTMENKDSFDSFEPFQQLKLIPLRLTGTGTTFYNEGKKEFTTNSKIEVICEPVVSKTTGKEVLSCQIVSEDFHFLITPYQEFDLGFTLHDRFIIATIPNTSNLDCAGIHGLKSIVSATRDRKIFSDKEPYCINLFLRKGAVAKFSFSFCNPERVLETTVIGKIEDQVSTILESFILKNLIDDYDSDGAVVSDKHIIKTSAEELDLKVSEKEIIAAIEKINRLFDNPIKKVNPGFFSFSSETLLEAKVSRQKFHGKS